MKNQRYGMYYGKKYLFTHYDPKKHKVWADDILVRYTDGHTECGLWLSYDSITWC